MTSEADRDSSDDEKDNNDGYKAALLPRKSVSPPIAVDAKSNRFKHLTFHRGMALAVLFLVFGLMSTCWPLQCFASAPSCDTVKFGYQCQDDISHEWGQYSPYFTVPSTTPDFVPPTCKITFAQMLARHGARFPTASKSVAYNATVAQIKRNVKVFNGKYAFLAKYEYNLGADDLTTFGQQEMVNSGIKFYTRYHSLTSKQTPFVRAASENRVVVSAENFTQGFHTAKGEDPFGRRNPYPLDIVIISEASGSNNTLNHDLCTAFESGVDSKVGSSAQTTFANVFIPPIQARLNHDLPGANLSLAQTISFMDLCPFNTVASDRGSVSQFCQLFSRIEWRQYAYYQSLGKYYGYGSGNPLGPTQGVGFTNELIARMTGKPVKDETSTNHTLDDNPETFPVGHGHNLFADFSHDNDLTGHFAAMGLYNTTAPLSNTTVQNERETHGYSAAFTVSFGARAYFEKMECIGHQEELVRVLVNDRVIPLQNCGADAFGRCRLSAWVDSLSFARSNGFWDQCFV